MKTKQLTFEEFVKKIEEGNEEFKKMTKAQKRVAIAQDSIDRIGFEQLRIFKSVTFSTETRFTNPEQSLCELLKDKNTQCTVCAKGALFTSYVGRVNKFKVGQVEDKSELHSPEMKKVLEIFTAKQLTLIETTFEGYVVCNRELTNNNQVNKCIDFRNKFTSTNNLLIAICKNIIENKGTFKP